MRLQNVNSSMILNEETNSSVDYDFMFLSLGVNSKENGVYKRKYRLCN